MKCPLNLDECPIFDKRNVESIFMNHILDEFDQLLRGNANDQLRALAYAPQLRQIIRELELRLKDQQEFYEGGGPAWS
jgi:hypothetical protein